MLDFFLLAKSGRVAAGWVGTDGPVRTLLLATLTPSRWWLLYCALQQASSAPMFVRAELA